MSYLNSAGALLPESAAANNWISGNSWAERLTGGGTNDSFDGHGGVDTLVGGGGDDYYWLNAPNQVITEFAGQGVDTARIWQSYALPANVENLIVFGGGNYAAGNAGDNIIQGLEGDQYLYGGLGQDVLIGGSGNDTFIVAQGEGAKVIQDFASWNDQLRLLGGPLTSFDQVKAAMTQQGSDVVLNDGGTAITFRNASVGQFVARDFQLPMNTATLGPATFSDDFNSLQTGSVWTTNFGFAGDALNSFTLPRNGEMQIYTNPSFHGTAAGPLGLNPYSIDNGVLTITAQPVSDATAANMWGYHYSSGMLSSNFSQTYGYFEMRAELPHGQGLWPAFWLVGPNNNEIDVLEGLGSDTKVAYNAIHSNAVPALGVSNFLPSDSGFHTYGVLWSPTDITFYADGTEIWRTATPADMNQPMHIVANLAVGGNWAGAPDSTTAWPAQLKIDYIHAYNLPSAGGPPPPPPPPLSPPPPPPPPPPAAPPPPVAGPQVINSHGFGDVLAGGTGNDTLNSLHGNETMTGGAGADTFVFGAVPWNPSHIKDFQVGVDRVDVSGLYLGGYRGADPVADGYVSFQSDGHGGTALVVDVDGRAGAHPWPDYVVDLEGVAPGALTAANVLGAISPPPPPPPPPPPAAGAQVINSHGFGDVLAGGAGADTLNSYQGNETMTGGAGADSFVFGTVPWNPSHIKDFQVGVDRIDVSRLYVDGYHGADPVADGYVGFQSDGHGGTALVVDVDGRAGAHPWPDYVVDLEGVSPVGLMAAQVLGGGGPPPPPPPISPPPPLAGQVLTAGWGPEYLTGGAGNDTLNASRNADQLTGGAGNDRFVWGDVPWSPAHVTDFTHGQDLLDLRGVFKNTGYTGSDPVADHYLSFVSDGAGGTKVLFDSDGVRTGQLWPNYIINLDHVAPTSMGAGDWIIR